MTRMANIAKRVIDAKQCTDVLKIKEMVTKGELLFSGISVNDCVTKSKFDNEYGCRFGARVFSLLNATTSALAGRAWRVSRTMRSTKTSDTPTMKSALF